MRTFQVSAILFCFVVFLLLPCGSASSLATGDAVGIPLDTEPASGMDGEVIDLQNRIKEKQAARQAGILSPADQAYEAYRSQRAAEYAALSTEIAELICELRENGDSAPVLEEISPAQEAYQAYQKEHRPEREQVFAEIESLIDGLRQE